MQPKWLEWARALQSISQNGLHYTKDVFDHERFQQIQTIAAEIAATYGDVTPEIVRSIFAHEHGPSTPKVDVRGVVFKEDAILLVREKLDNDRWTLPGGWVDVNETAYQAAVREIREESGYETRAVKLLAFYDKNYHDHAPSFFHRYTSYFLCELTGGEARESIETSGIDFFREAEIPTDLSEVRVTRNLLLHFFEHHHHPDWPTDFD